MKKKKMTRRFRVPRVNHWIGALVVLSSLGGTADLGSGGGGGAAVAALVVSNNNDGGSWKVKKKKQNNEIVPIRTVAIVGGGIAGLSLAHALEDPSSNLGTTSYTSPQMDVTIFDSRSSLVAGRGGGIQISGGMAVLKTMKPDLFESISKAALPLKRIRSRTRDWLKTTSSTTTTERPFATLLEIPIEESIRSVGGDVENGMIIDGDVMAYTIMRKTLMEILMENLSSETKSRIRTDKRLTFISSTNDGTIVHFHDGSTYGPFDMIVGCDGVNSAVKEYIETGTISSSSSSETQQQPQSPQGRRKGDFSIYSGIRIRFAVNEDDDDVPNSDDERTDDDDHDGAELRQYFGDGAYALYGVYGAGERKKPCQMAALCYLDENYWGPFKRRAVVNDVDEKGDDGESAVSAAAVGGGESNAEDENVAWVPTDRVDTIKEEMLKQLDVHGIPDVDLKPVVSDAGRVFEVGVYFHNPFSLRGWSRRVPGGGDDDAGDRRDDRFCVLCGDAAHAMPPFLGQGGNQAIQDAFCLAKKIRQYNDHDDDDSARFDASSLSADDDDDDDDDAITEAPDLGTLLKEYERIRWAPTASITAKSSFLGYLECAKGNIPSKFRDAFFFATGKLGIAKRVYLGSAVPRVD